MQKQSSLVKDIIVEMVISGRENANSVKQWLIPSVNYKLKATKFLFCLSCSFSPTTPFYSHGHLLPPWLSPTPGKKNTVGKRKGRLRTNSETKDASPAKQLLKWTRKNLLLQYQYEEVWSRGKETVEGQNTCVWGFVGPMDLCCNYLATAAQVQITKTQRGKIVFQ